MVAIYGVLDPHDGQLQYIGRSKAPIARLRRHIWGANNGELAPINCWVRQLGPLQPQLVILEEVSEADANDAERFWIASIRATGATLLNVYSSNHPDRTLSGAHVFAITVAHRRSDVREKSRVGRLGQKASVATKRKMSKSQRIRHQREREAD